LLTSGERGNWKRKCRGGGNQNLDEVSKGLWDEGGQKWGIEEDKPKTIHRGRKEKKVQHHNQ